MRLSRSKREQLQYPQLPLRFAMLTWLIAVAVVMVGIGVGLEWVTHSASFPRGKVYAGELRLQSHSIPLDIPAHLTLKEIVVDEGQAVVAGQTLAVLDVEKMNIQLQELNASDAAGEVLVGCLLAKREHGNDVLEAASPILEGAMALALKECETLRARQNREEENLASELALLLERRKLLAHRSKLETFEIDDPSIDELRRLLDASIEAGKLQERILTIQARLDEFVIRSEERVLTKVREVRRTIQDNRKTRMVLQSALALPRIQAEEAGTIQKLRRLRPGFQSGQPQTFGQIKPSTRMGYRARFAVPLADAKKIVPGRRVQIELLGWAGASPILTGEVSGLVAGDFGPSVGEVLVEVALSDGSQKQLESNRLALNDGQSASRMSVKLQPEHLDASLGRVVAASLGDGVLSRLLRQYGDKKSAGRL